MSNINGVTLMGLALDARIQGHDGPVDIIPEPAAPLAFFRIEGWEPNNSEDEAQGHKVMRMMESVGQAMANDRIDAVDVASLAVSLHLPGGQVIQALVPVAEQVLRALENDGKITTSEAMSIAGAIISAILDLRAS